MSFDRDERLIDTERNLALLMESRSGAEYTYLKVHDHCYTDWFMDDVIYDLMPSGLFPFLTESQNADSIGDRKTGTVGGFRPGTASALSAFVQNPSPKTLARGSPAH